MGQRGNNMNYEKLNIKKEASVLLILGILIISSTSVIATSDTKNISLKTEEFFEDFEQGIIPSGWKIIDDDKDGCNWEILESPEFPTHSGEYAIGSVSYMEPEGNLTPDNWLILPPMIVSDTSEISYWFSVVDSGHNEDLQILVSTTGGSDPDDFTDLIFEGSFSFAFWWQHTWDLSAYDG